MAQQVSFDATEAEYALVGKIVRRAQQVHEEYGEPGAIDATGLRMDLLATHANGNPMDFAKLLAAPEFTFCHDVYGIMAHIDRETGELLGHFSPRCSAPEPVEA